MASTAYLTNISSVSCGGSIPVRRWAGQWWPTWGVALCALVSGQSVACTLGFGALDGLVMGTRPGRLDTGILLYLLQARGMDAQALENLLYQESGLLGISGISNDMRDLQASDSPHAREAIDLFIYRAARELGSMVAAAGGLDALVFTAGIGEHDPAVRAGYLCAIRLAGNRTGCSGQSQW